MPGVGVPASPFHPAHGPPAPGRASGDPSPGGPLIVVQQASDLEARGDSSPPQAPRSQCLSAPLGVDLDRGSGLNSSILAFPAVAASSVLPPRSCSRSHARAAASRGSTVTTATPSAVATSATVSRPKYLRVITCAWRSFHSASRSRASWTAAMSEPPAPQIRPRPGRAGLGSGTRRMPGRTAPPHSRVRSGHAASPAAADASRWLRSAAACRRPRRLAAESQTSWTTAVAESHVWPIPLPAPSSARPPGALVIDQPR